MSIDYELAILDTLISEKIHPKNLPPNYFISKQQFDHWNGTLLVEKENISARMKKATYSYAKENHRRLYIQQHQKAITRLKNLLIDFLMPMDALGLVENKTDELIVILYKSCLSALRELLDFIHLEFNPYFDLEEPVPAFRLLRIEYALKNRLPTIKKLLDHSGEDNLLTALLIERISTHAANATCQPLTYKKYFYLKALMNAVEQLNSKGIRPSHYSALVVLLVYFNFNATAFKNYLVGIIHAEINAAESIEEKIETISFHHKEISQLQVKPGMALSSSLHSVQLDLTTWLFTEMTHLEKKQTLGIVAPIQFKEAGDPDAEKGIYSLLTVEELALFFKVQKDTGVLKNKNMKQVARCIAEDWHSKHKENISWQYLYNSMSSVEANTIKSLDSKMMDMVNYLRKMRGGMK